MTSLFCSSLSTEQHDETLRQIEQLTEDTPHYLVPAGILNDPAVIKAVQAMLGLTATPDVCRHVHLNSLPEDGDWHQDDYDGKPWPDAYNWAILFYFPQPMPYEMGGTAVLDGEQEIAAVGPAGTCLLARGDAMHRARANTTGRTRYMLKYLFRGDKDGS